MSLTIGQDDVFLSRRTRKISEKAEESVNLHRRRTISTGFEQSRGQGFVNKQTVGTSFIEDRKTQSFSTDIPLITRNLLRKISTLTSFQEDAEPQTKEPIPVSKLSLKQLPGFSIILNIIGVIIFQFGNVLVKSVEMDLVMLLLMRDVTVTFQTVPFTTYYAESLPPTKGKKLLLIVHGIIGGLHSMAHYYAVTVLPLGDVMMVSAVKPIFITFFSLLFLKESCGLFEILNIFLVMGGIVLVVQPPVLFGDSNDYTTHMFYTAMPS